MRHTKPLFIKLLIISVVLFSILPIFSTASILEIALLSILLTGATYIIGDLFILPRLGNLVASIADFGLVAASIWLFCLIFIGAGFSVIMASLFTSLFITFCEALFHVYMKEKVLTAENDRHVINLSANRFQTEFSEENEIHDLKRKDERELDRSPEHD